MNIDQMALEAAWEYERVSADGRVHDHGKLVAIIKSAIEKALAEEREKLEWEKQEHQKMWQQAEELREQLAAERLTGKST